MHGDARYNLYLGVVARVSWAVTKVMQGDMYLAALSYELAPTPSEGDCDFLIIALNKI